MNTSTINNNVDVAAMSVSEFQTTYMTFAQAAAHISRESGKTIRYQQLYQKYLQNKLSVVEVNNVKYIHIDSINNIITKRVAYFEK